MRPSFYFSKKRATVLSVTLFYRCNIKNSIKIRPDERIVMFPVTGGRGRRIRTLGTRFWRPLLYQLSYAPMRNAHRIAVGAALELLGRFELPTSSLPRMRSTD